VATSAVPVGLGAVKRGGAARGGARAAPQRSPDLTEPYPSRDSGPAAPAASAPHRRGRAPALSARWSKSAPRGDDSERSAASDAL